MTFIIIDDKFKVECGDLMNRIKHPKRIIIFLLTIVIIGLLICFKMSSNGILINDGNIKKFDYDITNLFGTWKTHSKTEPKDNKYYIYDLVFIFKKDGTCNLDGTMRIRYTNGNNGSSVTINQIGECYLNSSGEQFRMSLKDGKSLVFYNKWTDFKLNGDSMILSSFNYDKYFD